MRPKTKIQRKVNGRKKHKIIISKTTEKEIETEILIYLNSLRNCFAWKNNSTGIYDPVKKIFRKSKNRFAINGVADIIGIYKAYPLFIECKTPATIKRVSKDQDYFLKKVSEYGAIAFVACSVQDVAIRLNKIDEVIL